MTPLIIILCLSVVAAIFFIGVVRPYFLSVPVPRGRPRPRADSRRIKLLEEWGRFYMQGCYTGGECAHGKDYGARGLIERYYRDIDRALGEGDHHGVQLYKQFIRTEEKMLPRCEKVDLETWDNRFTELRPWLDDVNNMMEGS